MRIKFTHDFRGKLVHENFYLKDTEIEVDFEVGQALVALDHAIEVGAKLAPVFELDPAVTPFDDEEDDTPEAVEPEEEAEELETNDEPDGKKGKGRGKST
jgi:hypothetical protein